MTASPHIALVHVPWASLERPSLQLHLVQALVGRGARVHYLNLELARMLGAVTYQLIHSGTARFVGEAFFARALFGEQVPDALEALQQGGDLAHLTGEQLEDLRRAQDEQIPRFLSLIPEYFAACPEGPPTLVGISCTHDQLLAALAIGQTIKRAWPDCTFVLGGAQVSDSAASALVRAFDFIDWVFDGECENTVENVFSAILEGRVLGFPNLEVVAPCRGVVRAIAMDPTAELGSQRCRNLDELPVPDWMDFLHSQPQTLTSSLRLPIELSRGCWWDERRGGCVYCGLCGVDHRVRQKSPTRLLEELRQMSSQTWLLNFMATDTLVPNRTIHALSTLEDLDVHFFGEVRPEGSLAHVRKLFDAGFEHLQPGVESLDSTLLERMNKGTDLLTTLSFLKACAEVGSTLTYNLLYGVPGEQVEDYRRITALLPKLHHLGPPSHLLSINLVRHSPMFESPERFGITGIRPASDYGYLFPVGSVDLDAVAYLFDCESDSLRGRDCIRELFEAIVAWVRALATGARLIARLGPDFATIYDSRAPETPRSMVLTGPTFEVLRGSREVVTVRRLGASLGLDAEAMEAALRELVAMELAVEEEGRVLSLPLSASHAPVAPPALLPTWEEGGRKRG